MRCEEALRWGLQYRIRRVVQGRGFQEQLSPGKVYMIGYLSIFGIAPHYMIVNLYFGGAKRFKPDRVTTRLVYEFYYCFDALFPKHDDFVPLQ